MAILSGEQGGDGTAAASPYVIAMTNLKVAVLPHIVNALLVTSIFSAGNTYTYCATRSLYSLALERRAPKILTKTTRNGVPIFCFLITIAFAFLSFLSVSSASAIVLDWLVSLVTAGGLIDYVVMSVTYLRFYKACKVQGVDRSTFPYVGRFQPFCGWVGVIGMSVVVFFFGYPSFQPPDVTAFWQSYALLVLAPILFVAWKLIHRTKFIKASEIDLIWERPIVDEYEASFTSPPVGFWTELLQMVGLRSKKKDNVRKPSVVGGQTFDDAAYGGEKA